MMQTARFGLRSALWSLSLGLCVSCAGLVVGNPGKPRSFLAPSRNVSVSQAARREDGQAALSGIPQQHVVYTADSTVFGSLLRSMQSLALHTTVPERIVIHVVVPERDLRRAADLKACFSRGHRPPQVLIHKERPASINVEYQDRLDLKGHSSAFARLFIADYIPDVDRAVYLDADTLVLDDLAPLFDMPMNSALAAVQQGDSFQEVWGKWYSSLAARLSDPHQKVFNDGVLVLDLRRWRAEGITPDLESWASNAGASVDDQLLLNLEFQTKHKYDILDQGWNDYRVRSVGWPNNGWADELSPEDGLSNAKIIHWTGAKPWNLKEKMHWFEVYRHLWKVPGAAKDAKCVFT